MPLVFSRAFASCKGGCGKSALLFNVACAHALKHPEQSVAILDFSLTGDISAVALGGSTGTNTQQGTGRDKATEFAKQGIATTDLLAAAATAAAAVPSATKKVPIFMSSDEKPKRAAQPAGLTMQDHLLKLNTTNPMLPDNMYMSVTSPETASNSGFNTPAKRRAVKEGLYKMFADEVRSWVVFIDTDGDVSFTNRTKMGLLLAKTIAMPIDVDPQQFWRLVFYQRAVSEMADEDEKVLLIDVFILNKIPLNKWEELNPMPRNVVGSPFQPTHASIAQIDALTQALAKAFCEGVVSSLPNQFWFPEIKPMIHSSNYGCPLVLMQDNLDSLKSSSRSGWDDLTNVDVRDEVVNAVKKLATALEPRIQNEPYRTPERQPR
jgi:hypothetical protein